MDKTTKLLKNISIFGISQFASKILIFFLLPFYTRYLSTAEYGNADLVISTVSLFIPLFTLEIASGVMRYSIDNPKKGNCYLLNGIMVQMTGFLGLIICWPIFKYIHLFDGYLLMFYILYITTALYTLFSYYSRGVGCIKLVGIVGVLNTVVVIISNIVFLAFFRIGLIGYLLAYILGYGISIVSFIISLKRKKFLSRSCVDKIVIKNMLRYSIPLAPNNISWWGVSSVNKYIINAFFNSGVLGLYSVALRIPSLITTVQNIIAEGLLLSVLEEYGTEKSEKYYSNLYKIYSAFSLLMVSIVIMLSKILSKFLFSQEFFEAWKYVPCLCLSPMWGALSGYLGSFYAASKKNKGMFLSTVFGACVSIVITLVLINDLEIYAVLIGNIAAYFLIWLYRWIDVRKILKLNVNIMLDIISWMLVIILAFLNSIIISILAKLLIDISILCLILIINRKIYMDLLKYIIRIIKKKVF